MNKSNQYAKIIFAVLAAVVFTGHMPAFAQSDAKSCSREIGIGSWNIQWLGNPTAGKRLAQDAANVASYIKAGAVDLLALAEISRTSTNQDGAARNATLDAALTLLNQESGAQWHYALFPKREGARAPDDQWIGVAWNEKQIRMQGTPIKLPAEIDPAREKAIKDQFPRPGSESIVFSRWPHAVKFSAGQGQTDWFIVPAHWKSNTDGPATAQARAYETELLLKGLAFLRQQHSENDLIVLGDTNMLLANEQAGENMKAAGFLDCNGRDLGTHLPFKSADKAAPFDRIFVLPARSSTAETCGGANNGQRSSDFKIVRPSQWRPGTTNVQFRKLLSDHLMVRTSVCVGADDD